MTGAVLLLATAVLLAGAPHGARYRLGRGRQARSLQIGGICGRDPFAAASALDVLSVCLSAGMPVAAAAGAAATFAPPPLNATLSRASELLALGAEPNTAWQLPDGVGDRQCVALARLARRSAASGSALARAVSDLAGQCREEVSNNAAAASERAGVLIAGPLGLCFLPAFVCLGIVPVVAGLAGEIFGAVPS